MLSDKTRILVTHQTQYLHLAHKVVVVERGRIVAQGSYTQLLAQGVDLSSILPEGQGEHTTPTDQTDGKDGEGKEEQEDGKEQGKEDDEKTGGEVKVGNEKKDDKGAQMIREEGRAVGAVSAFVYWSYGALPPPSLPPSSPSLPDALLSNPDLSPHSRVPPAAKAMGGVPLLLLAVFLCCAERFLLLLADYWLPVWIQVSFTYFLTPTLTPH